MANHSIRVTKAKAEKQTIEQLALEVFAIIVLCLPFKIRAVTT